MAAVRATECRLRDHRDPLERPRRGDALCKRGVGSTIDRAAEFLGKLWLVASEAFNAMFLIGGDFASERQAWVETQVSD